MTAGVSMVTFLFLMLVFMILVFAVVVVLSLVIHPWMMSGGYNLNGKIQNHYA